MRLDKLLAHMGIGSRKDIKKLCKEDRVLVNGSAVRDSGMIVHPYMDQIVVDGDRVKYREYIYLMMNKPQGVISATEDRKFKTVIDLLHPEHQNFQPFPVGRLDIDTEGFLLLTNDGQLAHHLLSPRKHVPKTYYAKIQGQVTQTDVDSFAQGVVLEDGYHTLPGQLEIQKSDAESEILLTIYEGKFHQVKRMFAAVGKRVTFLKRIRFASLPLDESLQLGEYRELTEQELASLTTENDENIV
ncbi:rRNA pseudouridine synthase [Fodinisporobacter ferrooxydans]|uniref:Pseudouridine synthase n=1 Tax=Fodinisporobacter ferrooxydans TaxID=2901836 RepID=A0ABY4CRK9_9BACL|nr:rRNA pseudouridine synthase [Alicyclobacillaceae bacterium MYW30-H2]